MTQMTQDKPLTKIEELKAQIQTLTDERGAATNARAGLDRERRELMARQNTVSVAQAQADLQRIQVIDLELNRCNQTIFSRGAMINDIERQLNRTEYDLARIDATIADEQQRLATGGMFAHRIELARRELQAAESSKAQAEAALVGLLADRAKLAPDDYASKSGTFTL